MARPIYTIRREEDPSKFFEIEAPTLEQAALNALEWLGWLISPVRDYERPPAQPQQQDRPQ